MRSQEHLERARGRAPLLQALHHPRHLLNLHLIPHDGTWTGGQRAAAAAAAATSTAARAATAATATAVLPAAAPAAVSLAAQPLERPKAELAGCSAAG